MSSPAQLEDGVQTSEAALPHEASHPTSASPTQTSSKGAANDVSKEASRQIESSSVPSPPSPPPHHQILRHLSVLSLLSFSAIWGTLTRLGLVALNTYDGESIAPVIWAQGVGCFVMGWAIKNKGTVEKWYPPLYTAITTGYCGSVTTFSIWVLDVFRAFGNQRHFNRHGLHNVMDALTQTAATLAVALACLAAGKGFARTLPSTYISSLFRPLSRSSPSKSSSSSPSSSTLTLDVLCILLGLAFWIGSALLCALYPNPKWREVTFSIVQAPPGAILRWYLSRYNTSPASKRLPYWPLGTLSANLVATLVVAASFVGQRVGRVPGSTGIKALGCQALYGLEEGFCGCLSTVSTLAVELQNLRPRRAAVGYAVGSWALGVLICALVVGAPWWSIGMDGSCVGITESSRS